MSSGGSCGATLGIRVHRPEETLPPEQPAANQKSRSGRVTPRQASYGRYLIGAMTPQGQTTLQVPVLQTKGLGPTETADSPKVVKSVFTACCSRD